MTSKQAGLWYQTHCNKHIVISTGLILFLAYARFWFKWRLTADFVFFYTYLVLIVEEYVSAHSKVFR